MPYLTDSFFNDTTNRVLKDSEEKLPDVKASLDTATKELSLLNKSDKDRKDLVCICSFPIDITGILLNSVIVFLRLL